MRRKKKNVGEYYAGQVLSESLYQVTRWLTCARDLEFAIAQLKKYETPCQVRIYKNSDRPPDYAVFRLDDFERAQVV